MGILMELTLEQLNQILNLSDLSNWLEALNNFLPKYEINTINRISAFLAQTTHESNDFKNLSENLNYSAAELLRVFPNHFSNLTIANKYAHNPKLIANCVYANRMGNGNAASGDGYKYCGRGLIQITGKENYSELCLAESLTLNTIDSYIITPNGAIQSACWFWTKNHLNTYADSGDLDIITKKINGGTIGLSDRIDRYNRIVTILTA